MVILAKLKPPAPLTYALVREVNHLYHIEVCVVMGLKQLAFVFAKFPAVPAVIAPQPDAV